MPFLPGYPEPLVRRYQGVESCRVVLGVGVQDQLPGGVRRDVVRLHSRHALGIGDVVDGLPDQALGVIPGLAQPVGGTLHVEDDLPAVVAAQQAGLPHGFVQ